MVLFEFGRLAEPHLLNRFELAQGAITSPPSALATWRGFQRLHVAFYFAR